MTACAGAVFARHRRSRGPGIVRRVTTWAAERRAQAASWVAVLSLLWFVTAPPLTLYGFFAILSLSSTPSPDRGKGAVCLLVAGVLTFLLPLTATIVALRGGRPVLGSVYVVLTVLLAVPAVVLVLGAADTLGWWDPSPPPAPAWPVGCQDHSGGDTRCPGG